MSFTVKQDSVIMGVTEFRNNIPNLLKKHKTDEEIIITNRDKPLGVLIDFAKYQKIQEIMEYAEDFILTQMVEKGKKHKGKNTSLEALEKEYGI